MDELVALETEMRRFTDSIARVGPDEMQAIVPVLKVGGEGAVAGVLDTGGRKLDADLLLQANARALRAAGGEIRFNAGVEYLHDGDYNSHLYRLDYQFLL